MLLFSPFRRSTTLLPFRYFFWFCALLLLPLSLPGSNGDKAVIRIEPNLDSSAVHPLSFLKQPALWRPKIGLALSGGGSRGVSEVGVLHVLVEENIPIDYVVGTSMGSIIGGLYAAGYEPAEIEAFIKDIDWSSILKDKPQRRSLFFTQKIQRDRQLLQLRFDGLKPRIPPGLTPGHHIQTLLSRYTMLGTFVAPENFDNLRVPFRAVSTDLYSGRKIILRDGDLAEAMRASLSFPLLFSPVPRDSFLLVDGGMTDNIPTDVVRTSFPADIVIAIDATSDLRDPETLHAPWEIADQVTTIMQRERNEQSRKLADVVIRINNVDQPNNDFSNIEGLIDAGREVARRRLKDIRRLFEQQQEKKTNGRSRKFRISSVQNIPREQDRVLFESSALPIDEAFLASYLDSLYATERYQELYATLTPDSASRSWSLSFHYKPVPVLKNIIFHGNSMLSSDVLRSHLAAFLHQPLRESHCREMVSSLLKAYRQRGYSLAKITDLHFDAESGTGHIFINEGQIQNVFVEGLQRTKKHVVLNEMTISKGDIFNYERSQQAIANIYGTGLFERVSIELKHRNSAFDLYIKLQEKKYSVVNVAARFDSERRGKGLIEFADENFAGIGSTLSLQTVYGSKDIRVAARFSLNRIFRTYFTFSAEAFYQQRKLATYVDVERFAIGEYAENQRAFVVSLGQLVKRFGVVTVDFSSNHFSLDKIYGSGFPADPVLINKLSIHSILDTRDRTPFPRHGRYARFIYDMSNTSLGSDVSFVRLFWAMENNFTINKRHTFFPRITYATSDPTTPFVYRFQLNGPEHMLGLRYNEWVGRSFLLFNFGYRYHFPVNSQVEGFFGGRYDIGDVWRTAEESTFRDLTKAGGLMFGFITPAGTIAFTYGRMSSGRQRIYFSLGYQF